MTRGDGETGLRTRGSALGKRTDWAGCCLEAPKTPGVSAAASGHCWGSEILMDRGGDPEPGVCTSISQETVGLE